MSDNRSGPSIAEQVPLGDKLRLLRRPDTYPERPGRVEALETHMSWVFLTPKRVYKLKKPVRYEFLDFSTVAARRRDCELELTLNRRLAPDVYLSVLPLTRDADGALRLDGGGEAVDWLVQMRRLPAERMLDAASHSGAVSAADIEHLSAVLANFFRCAAAVDIDFRAYRDAFAESIGKSCGELLDPVHGFARDRIERLRRGQLGFLAHHAALLDRRVDDGSIKEGHGDLRPEHVCLLPEPVVIDCLEFKREFRILDPADELAYLAMECERLGAPGIGEAVLQRSLAASGDAAPAELVAFYKTVRAGLRARIAIWHTRDHSVRDHPHWVRRAETYIRLAERHLGGAG